MKIFVILIIFFSNLNVYSMSKKDKLYTHIHEIYETGHLFSTGLDSNVFRRAIIGYYNLEIDGKISKQSKVITIVDFTKPDYIKRMWIIDISKQRLLLNTWVAHGERSGGDYALNFSNKINSYESSIGFYVTGNTFHGMNGRTSLYLNGLDTGFNDNIYVRHIVMHPAKYIRSNYVGHSLGCLAVSKKVSKYIINNIKSGNIIFVNGNDKYYISKYLNIDKAIEYMRKLKDW